MKKRYINQLNHADEENIVNVKTHKSHTNSLPVLLPEVTILIQSCDFLLLCSQSQKGRREDPKEPIRVVSMHLKAKKNYMSSAQELATYMLMIKYAYNIFSLNIP